ncbi:MAG: YcbK family protein [Steroidobacterales bacterium]
MSLGRRRFLKFGAAFACAGAGQLLAPRAHAETGAPLSPPVRHLTLHNLHTDEVLDLDYRCGESYMPDAMARIAEVLRDFRTGEQHQIDPALMDRLHELAAALGADPLFSVISGYRSAQTNELLRSRSSGVAQRSLHMDGRAIDVRLPGIGCAELAACAEGLGQGGVGFYRRSDFVHLDTGAVRTWRG